MHHTHKGKFVVRGIFWGILFVGVFSLLVLLLWNWLMPPIFGLGTLTYFQALGLLILSKILFFGFNKRSGPSSHFRSKEYWKKRFEEDCKPASENLIEE